MDCGDGDGAITVAIAKNHPVALTVALVQWWVGNGFGIRPTVVQWHDALVARHPKGGGRDNGPAARGGDPMAQGGSLTAQTGRSMPRGSRRRPTAWESRI